MSTQSRTCVSVNDSLASRRRHQRFKNAYQQNGFDSQAAAWREAASRLSDWVQANMVNRSDVHGAYLSLMARTDPKKKAVTKREYVTSDLLTRHFVGADQGDLIGLPTTSPDNTSRWLAIDIDSRGGNAKAETWSAAQALLQHLEELGLRVLLFDSDGLGGFHLLVIFESAVATELLYEFGRWLLRNTDMPSLASAPEVFPKQPTLKPGQIGNWLRLPGRHHTHEHWTGVWNGFRWLFGEEAIQRILESETNTESQIPDIEDEDEPETNSTKWELKQISVDYPLEHSINLVLSRLKGVTRSGDQFSARCPAHNDHSPSLSIDVGRRGDVLLYCHRDCGLEAILEALELSPADLYPDETLVGRGQRQAAKIDAPRNHDNKSTATAITHWSDLVHQFEEALTEAGLLALANELKVSPEALQDICVGWDRQSDCYTFPERDAAFNVIGIMQRFGDGSKRCLTGGKRGLCLPIAFRERQGPILIVEGASDVAALLLYGFCAVGRPSAAGGGKLLAELLKDDPREIVVVGEFDPKPDTSWVGRDGAAKVARHLARELRRDIRTTMPPDRHKDVREWLAQLYVI